MDGEDGLDVLVLLQFAVLDVQHRRDEPVCQSLQWMTSGTKSISGRLSSMEQTTENLRRRLEQFVQKEEKKPSVKVELKKLKEEKKMVPQLPVPVKQQARE